MSTDYFYVQLRRSVRVAVPLAQTAEVAMLSQTQVCPIPGVASALLGVVSQRGKLLWVLELSDLLGLPPSGGAIARFRETHPVDLESGGNPPQRPTKTDCLCYFCNERNFVPRPSDL